ncbi:hypothetical protein J5N97_009755 [Dioscorea zingiberensis]|uniref:Uncharacterized protein n=1 Tax=Dioscorea zingiberensis TaxID=325984 RepID=A0A9D5CX28_9LILI|nr:hypothetical protein J5N97_009755 [Dioscorea zingiberensis]
MSRFRHKHLVWPHCVEDPGGWRRRTGMVEEIERELDDILLGELQKARADGSHASLSKTVKSQSNPGRAHKNRMGNEMSVDNGGCVEDGNSIIEIHNSFKVSGEVENNGLADKKAFNS